MSLIRDTATKTLLHRRLNMTGTTTTTSDSLPALFVVGPSSAGKTTLCDALATRLCLPECAYIKEVARTVMSNMGFTRDDVNKLEMQRAILLAHLRAESTAFVACERSKDMGVPVELLLSDRSAVDPVVYTHLSRSASRQSNLRSLIDLEQFRSVLPLYRRSSFILLAPVAEWLEDDGIRSVDDSFSCMDSYRDILREFRIPFMEIDESCQNLDERVERALTYLASRRDAVRAL